MILDGDVIIRAYFEFAGFEFTAYATTEQEARKLVRRSVLNYVKRNNLYFSPDHRRWFKDECWTMEIRVGRSYVDEWEDTHTEKE
jgi:hypothetical protein